jgi:hypothetical protein
MVSEIEECGDGAEGGIMRGTGRRDMGATTHFDMGSTTYLWLEFGFVGEREGKKRVFAGQIEFRANV